MDGTSSRSERYIQVDNETESIATRTTKEGRQYTYSMKVLQQPARARACGAGAKASADRRPVDPPPIVELKVFEGDSDKGADVTFGMKANYFLFATLEQARHIAHGRLGEDKQRLTVLTGTPVAGMVYLDRPAPAGYFIFPDLSVRHEGKYRLSFSLYEELKEAKDDDRSDPMSRSPTPPPDTVVTHRLEVKSQVFTVFSAKKFPGLTQSTYLSRMVAEQGCRVRIRRDVRMRRRDAKSGKEWDNYEDETAASRARVSSTPESSSAYPTRAPPNGYEPIIRPRSASNVSHQSLPALPVSRRSSVQDMDQAFQQPVSAGPHSPRNGYAHTSPYGTLPSQQYPPPPYLQQQPSMQPPPPQFNALQTYAPQQPLSTPVQPPQNFYSFAPAPTQSHINLSQYSTSPAFDGSVQPQRTSGEFSHLQGDQRRSSAPYSAPTATQSHFTHQPPASSTMPAPQQNGYHPATNSQQPIYSAQQQNWPSYGSQGPFVSRAPPPQPVQPPTRATGTSTPLSGRSSFGHRLPPSLPPLYIPSDLSGKLEPSPVQPTPVDPYYSAASTAAESRKRQHGSVFREPHQYAPMRQGARPSDHSSVGPVHSGGDSTYAADDGDDGDGDLMPFGRKMLYPRADGRIIQRHLPAHSDEL